MRGYKVLYKGLLNRYSFQYEIGKKYILNGDLKWKKNGFHFCQRVEDTLRYIDGFNDEIEFVEVDAGGDIVHYEDEYYGFYDMFASSEIRIVRIIPREEVFQMVLNSYDDRVKRFISLIKLTTDEKNRILEKYPQLDFYIDYYQENNKVLELKDGN